MYKLDNEGEGYELDMTNLFKDVDEISDKVRSSQQLTENGVSKEGESPDKGQSTPNNSQKSDGNEASDESTSPTHPSGAKSRLEPLFTRENFLATCILAGWDYLEPIKGIGFKTAYKLIEQYGDINSVLNVVASNSKYTVPKSWMKSYQLAYLTFLYQIVYDFEEEIWINLNKPVYDDYYGKMFLEQEDKEFLGQLIPKEYAKDVCEGNIDIRTKQPINLEKLSEEFKVLNDPMTSLISSESEDISGTSIRDMVDFENKPVLKKKSSSVQKKINFSMKVSTLMKKKIPSPFKSKIAGNLKNLSFVKELTEKDSARKWRKRNYKQLSIIDNEPIEISDDMKAEEEDLQSNSLMSLFKRAKKDEGNQENKDVFIPKIQTIKKKTFMRSLASSKS